MLGPRYLTTGCGKNGLPSTWLFLGPMAGLQTSRPSIPKISAGPMLNDEQQNFIIRSMKNNPNFRAFVDGRSELSHEAMKDIAPQTDLGTAELTFFRPEIFGSGNGHHQKKERTSLFFPDVLYSYQFIGIYIYIRPTYAMRMKNEIYIYNIVGLCLCIIFSKKGPTLFHRTRF